MQVHPKDTGDDVIALIDDRVIGAADEKDIKQHAHASQPTDGLKSPRHGPGTLVIIYRLLMHLLLFFVIRLLYFHPHIYSTWWPSG